MRNLNCFWRGKKWLFFLLIGTLLPVGCSDDKVEDVDTVVHVEKVKLELNKLSLVAETSKELVVTVLPEDAEDQTLEWSSNHPEIATVDETGLISALEPGMATIGCKSRDGGKVDFCLVTVTAKPVPVESISLNYTEMKLKKGEQTTLIATILPETATNQNVTWSTSNPAVVSVDDKGNLEALDFGEATVSVVTEDGAKEAKCEITVDDKGELRIATVEIPAGTFQMGVDGFTEMGVQNDERPAHQVTLTEGFRMSTYEISNAQYCFFLNDMGIDGSGMYNGHMMVFPSSSIIANDWGVHYDGTQWIPAEGYENYPVIFVTWYGAMEFAKYAGGSLPTEAQWEYACRGGLANTPFGLRDGNSMVKSLGNFNWSMVLNGGQMEATSDAPSTGTMPVDSHEPNEFGLYNMHGNVREWVQDWYSATYYQEGDMTDPVGPESGTYRVFRGGSWADMFLFCRCAFRNMTNPTLPPVEPNRFSEKIGFRIVLPLE